MNLWLFIIGCIGTRVALTYITAVASPQVLKIIAVGALIIAAGFTIIFVGGLRKTGIETNGKPIWWNSLRPLHAVLYFLVAYFAWINRGDIAWKILALDVTLGLGAFVAHHFLFLTP
jgi:hypothetical protein